MNGVLIDSCILLDLFTNDPVWADWSERILDKYSQTNTLFINSIIYTEISIGFKKIEELDRAISQLGIKVLEIPREALFLQFLPLSKSPFPHRYSRLKRFFSSPM